MLSFRRSAPPATESPSQRRAEWFGLATLLALTGVFYLWTATTAGHALSFALPAHDLYGRLTDGFLAGRTSFLEEPPAELARLSDPYDPAQNAPFVKYHDVTYYRGRYYLYFGPTPAVLLLAPWKLLTGASLPQHLAVVAFAWGAAAMAILTLRRVRDRFFPVQPSWTLLVAAIAVTIGSLWPVLLRRPLHYELAIASAAFCGLAGLFALLRAEEERRAGAWLALGGTMLGLAVAARPSFVFATASVLACWVWHRAKNSGQPWRTAWRPLVRPALTLGLPFAVVILGLLAYNYARFGSVTEFGTSYMLAGSNQQGVAQLGLRYVPINLYYHLFALPHLGAYFPFVLVTGFPPFSPASGYGGQENMYGVFVTLPFLWTLAALWPALKPKSPQRPWQAWARGVALLGLGNLALLLLLKGAANRYQLDYLPLLVVLAVLAWWMQDERSQGWTRRLLRGAWVGAVGLSVVFSVLVSLQHNELLKFHNPELYAALARTANGATEPLTRATRESGPLRVEVTLPLDRTGKLEPLVVTGVSFRADFLYIFYKDERRIQIGFEHTSYGGPLSPPFEIDYDVPHELVIEMGSLYPPREHPYWDTVPTEERGRRKRTLRVQVDGQTILEGQVDFYDSSPGHIAVGRNPVSEAFGRRFTGVVRSVRRGGETK